MNFNKKNIIFIGKHVKEQVKMTKFYFNGLDYDGEVVVKKDNLILYSFPERYKLATDDRAEAGKLFEGVEMKEGYTYYINDEDSNPNHQLPMHYVLEKGVDYLEDEPEPGSEVF